MLRLPALGLVLWCLLCTSCWYRLSCSEVSDYSNVNSNSNSNNNNSNIDNNNNTTSLEDHHEVHLGEFVDALRKRFDDRFQRQCSKYPFVRRYAELLQKPPGRYLWFVEEEKGQATGGLGDRLAGLITAAAYALRSNRTLLIHALDPFDKLFVPLRPQGVEIDPSVSLTYSNWSWSGWKNEFAGTMHWERCVNPRNKAFACALDRTEHSAQTIKYYSNRSYLCRWLVKREELRLTEELRDVLGITLEANLYEVAGCLLRTAISPSELLWNKLRHLLRQTNTKRSRFFRDTRLIGMHFRCGDSSFSEKGTHQINPSCYFTSNETWKGTKFYDDISWASPVDLAHCANRQVQHTGRDIFNIASDNVFSSKQIEENLRSNRFLSMPRACHVDLKHSQEDCTASTLTQWFLLSLSDFIVTQSLGGTTESSYRDRPEMIERLQGTSVVDPAPISAFSRMASLYGLTTNHLRYGDSCRELNMTSVGHYSHGNWICQPITFYR